MIFAELDTSSHILESLLTQMRAFEYSPEWDNSFPGFFVGLSFCVCVCAIHDVTTADMTHWVEYDFLIFSPPLSYVSLVNQQSNKNYA